MHDKEKYKRILELLMNAELAARNDLFETCGTYAKQAAEEAWNLDLVVYDSETP